jgi:FkbM family methyltransferase
VRANSVDAHEAVTVLGGYEYPYAVLKEKLPLQSVVLDIGAHIGAFTVYLQGQRPDLRVYALEPAADNFDLLAANLKLNDLAEVKAFPEAMTGGETQVFLSTAGSDSNAYHLSESGQSVSGIGLDDFLSREKIGQVNLLKMDCEGAEYDILSGSRHLHLISSIIMEYHKQGEERNDVYLVNLLEAQGFILRWRRDLSDRSRGLLYFVRAVK